MHEIEIGLLSDAVDRLGASFRDDVKSLRDDVKELRDNMREDVHALHERLDSLPCKAHCPAATPKPKKNTWKAVGVAMIIAALGAVSTQVVHTIWPVSASAAQAGK